MGIRYDRYFFDGPIPIDTWAPPERAGVYAILVSGQLGPDPIYFGESGNLLRLRKFRYHPKYPCWLEKAGSEEHILIAFRLIPHSTTAQRRFIRKRLITQYRPACNQSLEQSAGTFDSPEDRRKSTSMTNTARRIPLPTPVELEILQLVWNLKTATVRDVYEAILEQRRIAYTTVMTMMKIMERKGILRKAQQQGRAFIYKAAHTRERVNKAMLREFMGRVFGGSSEALLNQLIDDSDLSLEKQS